MIPEGIAMFEEERELVNGFYSHSFCQCCSIDLLTVNVTGIQIFTPFPLHDIHNKLMCEVNSDIKVHTMQYKVHQIILHLHTFSRISNPLEANTFNYLVFVQCNHRYSFI